MPMDVEGDLFEQNDKLQRKLAKCKADKEFVWRLWKQLQVDSPDVTKVVDLVVTREKEKSKQRDANFKMILQSKDNEIAELNKALLEKSSFAQKVDKNWRESERVCEEMGQQLKKRTEELTSVEEERGVLRKKLEEAKHSIQGKVDSLNKELKTVQEERNDLEEKYRHVSSQLQKLQPLMREMEEQMSALNQECSQNNVKCKNLDADLVCKSEQLKKANELLKKRTRELKRLRDTVSELQQQSTVTQHLQAEGTQQARMETLLTELCDLKASARDKEDRIECLEQSLSQKERQLVETSQSYKSQIAEFEGQLKVLQENAMRTMSYDSSGGPPYGAALVDLKVCLERTEVELFDVKNTLKHKEKELTELKVMHDRRLERMRTIQEEHKIVVQQLRLYEGELSSPGGRTLSPQHRVSLQQEDSTSVWNDLNYYKKHCIHLYQKLVQLSEECDVLKATSITDKVKLCQLQSQTAEKHDDLFKKFSAIADLELESVPGTDNQQRKDDKPKSATPSATPSSHSSRMVLKLQKEKGDLHQHLKECKQLCVELQTKLEVVRRDLQRERRRTAVMKTRKPTTDRSTSTTSPAQLPPACRRMSDRGTQTDPTSTSGRSHPNEQDGRHQFTNASTQTSTAQPTFSVSSHSSSHLSSHLSFHSSSHPPDACPSGGTAQKKHHFRTLSEGSSHHQPLEEAHTHSHQPLEEAHTHSQRKGKLVDSGSTISKTPQCICGLHKCLEDSFRLVKLKEEIKTFKLKCKELEKQVSSLIADKQTLKHSLSVEKRRCLEQEKECSSLNSQISNLKGLNEQLSRNATKWREAYSETRSKYELLESIKSKEVSDNAEKIGRLVAEKKRAEERLKSCLQRSREEKQSVRSVEEALGRKTEECKDLEHRVSCLERDLKQKRSLVNGLKEKDRSRAAFMEECQGKMDSLVAELRGLSGSNEQYRTRVQGLRSQLEVESEDKRKLSSKVDQLTKDLTSSVQRVSQSKLLLQQETGSSQLLKDNLRQLENTVRDANKKVAVYKAKCDQLTAIVAEHQLFTKHLLHKLHSRMSQRRTTVRTEEERDLTSRARELARVALNLSDKEVTEFLSDREGSEEVERILQDLERIWCDSETSTSLSSEMLQCFSPLIKELNV